MVRLPVERTLASVFFSLLRSVEYHTEITGSVPLAEYFSFRLNLYHFLELNQSGNMIKHVIPEVVPLG